MDKRMKRGLLLLTISFFTICFSLFSLQRIDAEEELTCETTILFTHDTHSNVLSLKDENGNPYGGYTRLYTMLKIYRDAYADHPVLTLDAGDFSMGTLFQSLYTTEACELRLLGKMGFDVTTFGNHEYDYRDSGLAKMLNAALDSKEKLPLIVEGNYHVPVEGDENYTEDSKALQEAFDRYGVKEYTMLEKDGVRYAIFGIFGVDAHEYSPMSGMNWEDNIDAAERIVKTIQENEDYDYIICLSHSGTEEDEKDSEDHELAKKVDGIDVIISAHTHTTLHEPIVVEDTLIVSAGCYTENLGVLRIAKDKNGKLKVLEYDLVPLDAGVKEDKTIIHAANQYKDIIAETYLSGYGLEYDRVLARTDFSFDGISDVQRELPLGNLISDSYVYAVKEAEGENYENIDFAVVPNGVIRNTFYKGEITVADAFAVSSLGMGADGTAGYPLISVYLKGSELKDALEVDASVTPIMDVAQLYASGVTWTFNTKRIIFNKVTECYLVKEDGTRQNIEDDKLYRVVTGLYSGQMLGAVEGKSFGILSIVPRDKDGNPIKNLEDYIIYDANGNELKEWYALATYLDSFEEEDGVSVVPDRYKETEGRKNVYASYNIIELLKAPNWITITILCVIFALIGIIVFCIIYSRRRRRYRKSYGKYR
ncbi:MAG: 5'-nucleotidase C-terminal domain-containing protein [Lachnospiraceae bacterium]|nr:5'-nucleotidase C-terminal domain-containing protein [Lachnospiraceae bacterium]